MKKRLAAFVLTMSLLAGSTTVYAGEVVPVTDTPASAIEETMQETTEETTDIETTEETTEETTDETTHIETEMMTQSVEVISETEEIATFAAIPDEPEKVTPKLGTLLLTDLGCELTWEAVDDAKQYWIYRSEVKGTWGTTPIAKTNERTLSYTDNDVKFGHTYYYTVVCCYSTSPVIVSGYDKDGLNIKVIADVPELLTVGYVGDENIRLTWATDTPATTFAVYRKINDGAWTRIGTTSELFYDDKVSADGRTYTYSVAVIYKDDTGKEQSGGYEEEGLSVQTILALTKLQSVSATAYNKITVKWNKVANASDYEIYRKEGSGGWKLLKTVSTLSYEDTVEFGTTYSYRVRACCTLNNQKVYGSYSEAGLSAKTVLPMPTNLRAGSASNGAVYVTWNKVAGAEGYIVYRKEGNGKWTQVKVQSGCSYSDTKVKTNVQYAYTVKAYMKDSEGEQITSSYDTTGAKYKYYVGVPTVKSIASTGYKTIKMTWSKVSGAEKYYIYRKSGNTWKKIASVSASTTSYTDKNCTTGTKYEYRIRAMKKVSGSERLSSYKTGVTGTALIKSVKLYSAKSSSSGIKVKWKKTDGANGYYVYRKTSGGSWTKIATLKSSNSLSYTDKTAVRGRTYYYTVKGYRNVSGKQIVGLYNTKGLKAVRK